ncbi:conserved hypothetical protein [Leifsonia xyli subsp. xyli str. CTCB07]|uniref:Signal peptidase I n=1 Tax=Leifsonia xyli subsp. xyli (strain CTCB07) TaxID=281090 RepID=Q6ACL6_LEIXX|nr:hypothetical protein [Leifsonia xyli]AAT89877.1 conserved hypothetical protein [Leifsonia xyli subsp. xyli str. CTCB07]
MRGTLPRAGNALLTLAAVAGSLCIVGAVTALVFPVGLILFSTGSMSPAIPAGAVALVREVPAAEVRRGDIVTVDRAGQLPITHRVVRTEPLPGGVTELVLRGDANAQNDPAPYRVTRVRLVVASMPGGAQAIAFASSPVFLGIATVGAAGLVAWAFWPREQTAAGRPARGRRRGSHRSGAATAALVLVLAGASLAAALDAPAPGARAAEPAPTTTISGRYLTLTSAADPARLAALRPGAPVRWTVGVSAHPPTPATIRLGLTATGALAPTLAVSVIACDARWTGAVCPGTSQTLLSGVTVSALPLDAPGAIGGMPSAARRWLAVQVTLASGVAAEGSTQLTVWAWGAGDSASTTTRPSALPETGSRVPALPLLLACGAVAGGAALAGAARVRKRPS